MVHRQDISGPNSQNTSWHGLRKDPLDFLSYCIVCDPWHGWSKAEKILGFLGRSSKKFLILQSYK
jgi:hypothetical protein